MAIVFSAITPHPPILIPQIGKDNISRLATTKSSFTKLQKELEKSSAETILIISPHGPMRAGALSMNLAPEFKCNLEDFGNFSCPKVWRGNIGLTHKIKEALESKAPLQLFSDEKLDYGASVPLLLLTEYLPKLKIIPLYFSDLSIQAHYEFGKLLKKELLKRKENIAVIASGDLSHRLRKDSPGGFSPKGKKFDKQIIKYLQAKDVSRVLSLNEKLILEAGECGLKSIVLLLGILDNICYQPELLSYESPFGVGYLTMNLRL